MTVPTTDAVAQAREKYDRAVASLDAIRGIEFDVADEEKAVEDAWLEVIAAVRAECAADTKRLDWMQERYVAADFEYTIDEKPATALIIHAPRSARVGPNLRATIDAALEAQP